MTLYGGGTMSCNHKPKEFIKAAFCYDAIFTCKKCGQDIFWVSFFEFHSLSWVCGLIMAALAVITIGVLSIFLEYENAWWIGLLISISVVCIGDIIYVNKTDGLFTSDPKD